MDDVVTCFLRDPRTGNVVLLRRSEETGSYAGKWGAVSGYVECEDTEKDVNREIREETGIKDAERVRSGDSFVVEDDEYGDWRVHPYLYDTPTQDITTNYETESIEWCAPTEMRRRDTVPRLWDSYAAVAPTLETVKEDNEHGSAYIAARALEVLRDTAATEDADEVHNMARELIEARPSMAAVGNRVARAANAENPEEIEGQAHSSIAETHRDDESIAKNAAERLAEDEHIVTLSRSGTVAKVFEDTDASVTVAESLPGGEGFVFVDEVGADRLVPDSCITGEVRDADAVVVGADTVLPDGTVVNKVGSLAAGLAADRFGTRFLAVTSTDKVSPDEEYENEYVGTRGGRVPVFERVSSDLVEVVTEEGRIDDERVKEISREHARLRESLR